MLVNPVVSPCVRIVGKIDISLPTHANIAVGEISPSNENGGIVPPWLRNDFTILPMPDGWREPDDNYLPVEEANI